MDKSEFYKQLIETLRNELILALGASRDAAAYATNEESKADSQWDTQGLEASYLAAGQAGQARKFAEMIESLHSGSEELLRPKTTIVLGALFSCSFGSSEEWFFFARAAGGQVVQFEGKAVTVISRDSPLASRLLNLRSGDCFRLPNGELAQVLTVE